MKEHGEHKFEEITGYMKLFLRSTLFVVIRDIIVWLQDCPTQFGTCGHLRIV
jgi:hypothetical protein